MSDTYNNIKLNFDYKTISGQNYPYATIKVDSNDYKLTMTKYGIDSKWLSTDIANPAVNVKDIVNSLLHEKSPIEVVVKGKDVTLESVVDKDQILDFDTVHHSKAELMKDIYSSHDFGKFADMMSDPKTMEFWGNGNGYNLTQSQDRMTDFVNKLVDDGNPLSGYYVYGKLGKFVGSIDATDANDYFNMGTDGRSELELFIGHHHQDKGYGTDALKSMVFLQQNLHDLGYDNGLSTVVATANPLDLSSVNALQDAGFSARLTEFNEPEVINSEFGPRIVYEYELM